ncbi:MAG: phosphotransferase family protein [bacterium]
MTPKLERDRHESVGRPQLKKLPDRAAVHALVHTLERGGRLLSVRTLHGGLGCSTHAVKIAPRVGRPYEVVLRRYHDGGHGDPSAICHREWRTVQLLAESPVVAPRPIWADVDGQLFGQPVLVETRLPGHAMLGPSDVDRYVSELAGTAALIHSVSISGQDWAYARRLDDRLTAKVNSGPSSSVLRHPDGAGVWSALRKLWPQVSLAGRTLRHGDYWPGNTLWLRGHIVGVVDWEEISIGDPAREVSYCRQDLAMLFGLEAADRFLRHYERIVGQRIEALAFWDLLAVARALPDVERWLPGYHDFGRTDISPVLMQRRHRAFIAQAFDRAG